MNKKIISIIVVCLLIVGVFSTWFYRSQRTSKNQQLEEFQPTSSMMITEEQLSKEDGKIVLVLYFADSTTAELVAEKRFIPKSKADDITALAQTAIEELEKGPISGSLTNTLPKGAKKLTVKVDNKTATVNMTKDFVKKHPGGSTGEVLTVYAIVNTLTGIDGIDTVKFTIDDETVQEFKGHLEFDKPFKGDESYIKPEEEQE